MPHEPMEAFAGLGRGVTNAYSVLLRATLKGSQRSVVSRHMRCDVMPLRNILRIGAVLVGLVLVSVITYPLVIGWVDRGIAKSHGATPLPPDGPVAFGTGGAVCAIGETANTFTVRDRVHFVAQLPSPEPLATQASVDVSQGDRGNLLTGYPATVSLSAGSACVSDTLPPLAEGHYQVDVWIFPPPDCAACRYTELFGEFAVTP
jgi:hypothetical protein